MEININRHRTFSYLLQTFTLGLVVYDLGFEHPARLGGWYVSAATLFFLSNLYLHFVLERRARRLVWAPTVAFGAVLAVTLLRMIMEGEDVLTAAEQLRGGYLASVAAYFVHRASLSIQRIFSGKFNPATFFVGSFAILVLLGSLLLLLPTATTGSISVVDAVFTSTSAVCVTGLIVVDTAADFTFFGQCVILALIQLGGLGILTFTTFFAFFFKGGGSFQESLYVKNIVNSEQLGNVFKVVVKIVVFTLAIEMIGAIGIYRSVPADLFEAWYERIFFSVFHSVSAFCNAGFSILTDGFYDAGFRFNYGLQWTAMALIVLGGLGFNILNNLYDYLKINIKNRIKKIDGAPVRALPPRIISLNSRLVIQTTALLLLGGAAFFFFTEYRHTLSEHSTLWGKLTNAFFYSVTPRTAGFNTVDMSALAMPAIMATMALMWIGASPASTGGGIKTSTFALALMNISVIVRGKKHLEFGRREVPVESVQRAFAIVALSIFVIGGAVFLLALFEPEKELTALIFESISAYSTVGLSLGITGDMSTAGKVVLIFTMFVGRVGAINLLTGMLRRMHYAAYRYPEEQILIN
jgi:trk system potassium uptake protein